MKMIKIKNNKNNHLKNKSNLKFINNLQIKFIKIMQIMKYGKMIITSIHISLKPIPMKLIATKITVEKVKLNIMTVDNKTLMESKWRKWTPMPINKLINNLIKTNKFMKINKKINNFFNLSNWMIKNQVIGAIKMINMNKLTFLLMLEPDLPTGIRISHNWKYNLKINFLIKKIKLIFKILKEIKINPLSNKIKKHKILNSKKLKITHKELMR